MAEVGWGGKLGGRGITPVMRPESGDVFEEVEDGLFGAACLTAAIGAWRNRIVSRRLAALYGLRPPPLLDIR